MKIKSIITYVAWIFILLLVPIVSADLNYTTLNSVFSNFSVCYNSEGIYNNGSTILGTINGTLDDVMIFNTSLTSAQILAIYNNQSARFLATGTQDIVNQSYMNISTGNNRVNVTTYIESLLGSSINLTVGYYNTSWSYTTPQVVSSGTNLTFNISSTSTNLTLNYTFYAGGKEEEKTITYNFNTTYENINMWAYNSSLANDNPPPANANPPTGFTYNDITTNAGLDSSDDSRVDKVVTYGQEAYYLFNATLPSNTTFINWTWEGKDSAGNQFGFNTYFYLWNGTGWWNCASNAYSSTDVLRYCSNSSSIYYNNSLTTFLVYGSNIYGTASATMSTDFVKLEITYKTETLIPFYSPIIQYNITYDVWNEAIAGDTEYPQFSTYYDNNASLTDTGIGKFNVTVENTNGTVILHINNTNVYATNLTSNVYNASHTFGIGGTYLYNWTAYGNGTDKNLNTSINRYYVVNTSTPSNCWTYENNLLFIPNECGLTKFDDILEEIF